MKNFYDKKNKKKVLLIKFNENESFHLNFITNFIKNFETNELQNFYEKKIIILIIHLKRKIFNENEKNSKKFVSNFLDYEPFFIDNLNSTFFNINFNEFLNENENQQIFNLLKIEKNLEKILFEIYLTFNFEFVNENYIDSTIEKIINNKNTKNFIIEKIKQFFFEKKNILQNFFKSNQIKKNDIDILNRLNKFNLNLIKNFLIRFFYCLETFKMIKKLINLEKNDKNIKIMNKILNGNFIKNLNIKNSPLSNFIQKKSSSKIVF